MLQLITPRLRELVPLSDEEVVERVLRGDTPAFELLMRRHNQRLFRLARSVVSGDAEAEDVVQEGYVRAYEALARFEGRSSFITWLSRIVFHEALRVRRKARRVRAVASPGQLGPGDGGGSGVSADCAGRGRARVLLFEALDTLPDAHRAVVMLRLVEGLSTQETAQSLRMTESNVKVSLHRAKKQLAAVFEERAIDELREHYTFAGERCDRIVLAVFRSIGSALDGDRLDFSEN